MSTKSNATEPIGIFTWTGTPIFLQPSRFNGNCGRVFARDVAGLIVAEFLGANGFDDALKFCEMFGEKNHWRVANSELVEDIRPREGLGL